VWSPLARLPRERRALAFCAVVLGCAAVLVWSSLAASAIRQSVARASDAEQMKTTRQKEQEPRRAATGKPRANRAAEVRTVAVSPVSATVLGVRLEVGRSAVDCACPRSSSVPRCSRRLRAATC